MTGTEERDVAAAVDAADVQLLLLRLGVALTMTGDAVSEVEDHLGAVAAAYGYPKARIAVFPTLLIVALGDGGPAGLRTVEGTEPLRLDQASEVIRLAQAAQATQIAPREALAELDRILGTRSRFSAPAYIASHSVLTIGLGLVIRPAAVDVWVYAVLGAFVALLKLGAARYGTGGHLLPFVAAGLVSAVAFLAHGGNDAASLRLTIPPLVTFLPGALLTMATVDLALGEMMTGASRFVAGLLQLALLAIGIVVGAQLVGDPHAGPIAGDAADTLGSWAPWAGVALFGVGIYVHNSAPPRSLPWLLVVLFTAWAGQLVGKQMVDATLSGFVGAAVMVPVAHLVAKRRTSPPAHIMFLPAFWLLVPGTIGLIGITELVGNNREAGSQNLGTALIAIPAVALGILVGTMVVHAARTAARSGVARRLASPRR